MTNRFTDESSKKLKREVVAAMRRAGIRPELIYAYEKTGLLLDEAGYKGLSADDRARYDGAIDQFFAAKTPKRTQRSPLQTLKILGLKRDSNE